MALCRELTSLASCSGRIDDTCIPNLQSRHRNNLKTRIARFFTKKDFVACRVARTPATDGPSSGFKQESAREREWQIRATRIDAGGSAGFQRFYAKCEKGLEEILAAELSSPLISAALVEPGCGGVSFVGTQTTGYNANLWLRTGVSVLCELARGLLPKGSSDRFYNFVRAAADWRLLLVDDAAAQTRISRSAKRYKFRKFAVQISLLNFNGIENQASVSTSVSNAIWDSLRDACGSQWPEPAEREDALSVPLFLHVDGDTAILYRDMSGVSLHKRGVGDTSGMAKVNEGLAAAVLIITGWNHMVPGFGEANKNARGKDQVLLDPFCGTGTFLIQAALMASNVAPGLMRRQWPFQTWHDYDQRVWTQCRDAAASMQVSSLSGARLIGNDMNDGAIAKCKRFARAAGVLHLLDLSCETSRHYQPPFTPSLVVTNPPCSAPLTYSSLRGEDERLLTLWQGFGQFLKSQCRGADVYVLSENDWLTHAMHMVPDRKWEMQPDKQWRGKLTGRRNEKIFGSQERKLLHYHVQFRRAQGDPLSVIPFSSLSPKSSTL